MSADSVAIIPARAGSKRIPGKNIKPFNGVPMIARSILAAVKSGLFRRILVSTDSAEIAAVAAEYGAECPFMRPPELADDKTPTAPVLRHALQFLADQGESPNLACCIYATAPFIQIGDLTAGHDIMLRHRCSSAFTVSTFGFPILRALKRNEDGSLAMFWPEYEMTRSQDLPEAYYDVGQFYWIDVARFMAEPKLYCRDSQPIILPRWRVQDIDTPEDWERASLMYKVLSESGALA